MGMYFFNFVGSMINGVIIMILVVQDLEFEYIMVSNEMVYVILQENNGVVVIDLNMMIMDVVGLGFKNWFGLNIDVQEDGVVGFGQYEGLYGVYMFDIIIMFSWKGVDFLLIVNEGDVWEYFIFEDMSEIDCIVVGGQDWDDRECLVFIEEVKIKDFDVEFGFVFEMLQMNGEVDDLWVINVLGDVDGNGLYDVVYSYGVWLFIIWD